MPKQTGRYNKSADELSVILVSKINRKPADILWLYGCMPQIRTPDRVVLFSGPIRFRADGQQIISWSARLIFRSARRTATRPMRYAFCPLSATAGCGRKTGFSVIRTRIPSKVSLKGSLCKRRGKPTGPPGGNGICRNVRDGRPVPCSPPFVCKNANKGCYAFSRMRQ